MSTLDQFKTVFFEECADLLASAEEHLSRLSDDQYDIEDIHAIFRAVHSVKGGAGTFGFTMLVSFTHVFETALDIVRNNHVPVTSMLLDLFLRANDIMTLLVQNAENNLLESSPDAMESIQAQLLAFIESHQKSEGGAVHQAPSSPNVPNGQSAQANGTDASSEGATFHIVFEPHLDLMRFGNEPYLILRELKRLAVGGDFSVTSNSKRLPSLPEYNVEHCYLIWEITLKTDVSEERIKECFEFVEDECKLVIQKKGAVESNLPVAETEVPTVTSTLENIVAKENAVTHGSLDDDAHQKPAVMKQLNQNASEQQVHSIRVELDRIDRLVNTVGEMVIKQAMLLDAALVLKNHTTQTTYDGLTKGLEELTQHTRELQESVMAIRAQPVKAVFARMPRLVRELGGQLSKDVRIEMSGENTEIDKTVIERLGEPLTHMIRNAVDHGIESPDVRISRGKPPFGTIHLNAEHKSGRIVIQVMDDGGGIPRDIVLQKAKDRGVIDDNASLSGEEIDQLIFHPGFSTASSITNISGRGVGMDVVKKSIQALGGRISIDSVEGKGCTFNLLLPLTLAVLDGMIVRAGRECYVIPLVHIIETLRPTEKQVYPLVGGADLLDLRQKNIPLIFLHRLFNIPEAIEDPTKGIVVVIETENGQHIGLVVDEILTQQQVVLKSLEANYDPIPGISAATILGTGRVSLILDVNMLSKM